MYTFKKEHPPPKNNNQNVDVTKKIPLEKKELVDAMIAGDEKNRKICDNERWDD